MNNTATLRKKNMLDILKVVWKNPMISRPEIAKITGLTNMTVTTLMAELERLNLVVQEGVQESKGGRKALLYSFNNNSRLIIGVNIQIERASVDLFDLCGVKLSDSMIIPLRAEEPVEQSLFAISKAIQRIIANGAKDRKDILGIGITVPGRVDYKSGLVYHLTHMPQWRNVPLKDMMEQELHIPVFVERDTNSHIACLKLSGQVDSAPNMVYLAVDEGVGAGVIIDDRVYHGSHGIAGEAGHISLNPDGPLCNCGNRGCVEMYASHEAIIRAYDHEQGHTSTGGGESDGVLGNRSRENAFILELAERAEDGDKAADSAFRKAAEHLTACIVTIMNMYDPGVIVIECKWMRIARKYFHQIAGSVFEKYRLLNRNDIKIILNPIEDIFSVSPYTVVLERMLMELVDNILIN